MLVVTQLGGFGGNVFGGTDLITNGGFGSDTGWTHTGSNAWTISSGKAHHTTGDASSISQAIAFVAGGLYRVVWTISNYSGSANFQIRFSGGSEVTGALRSANGTYTEDIRAVTGNNTFAIVAFTNAVGSVDDVSCQRIG